MIPKASVIISVYPLKKVPFEEFKHYAPNNIEECLHEIDRGIYGDLMLFSPMHSIKGDSANDYKETQYLWFENLMKISVQPYEAKRLTKFERIILLNEEYLAA